MTNYVTIVGEWNADIFGKNCVSHNFLEGAIDERQLSNGAAKTVSTCTAKTTTFIKMIINRLLTGKKRCRTSACRFGGA